MSQISDQYASPLLRWALLLEETPGATYTFEIVKGTDLPPGHAIPPQIPGGDGDFCLATITFPPETGKDPAIGYKALAHGVNKKQGATGPVETVEQWQQLCTKCLGRALKRCGYPDDMDELRAIIRWRGELQKLRMIADGTWRPLNAIPAAGAAGALGGGEETVDDALSAAATSDPEAQQADRDDVIDAESDEVPHSPASTPPPSSPSRPPVESAPLDDDLVAEHRQAVNDASSGGVQSELRNWANAEGITWTKPANPDHARKIIAKARELLAAKGA